MSDFDKKTNFILDSSMPRRVDGRRQFFSSDGMIISVCLSLLPTLLFSFFSIFSFFVFVVISCFWRSFASELWGYKRLLRIKNFEWEIVDVPRQNNGYLTCLNYILLVLIFSMDTHHTKAFNKFHSFIRYSCGIYLLKWLENLSCQSLWSDKTSYEVMLS